MEKIYCSQGAHVSFPIGTIKRIIVTYDLCQICPCYPCQQVKDLIKT